MTTLTAAQAGTLRSCPLSASEMEEYARFVELDDETKSPKQHRELLKDLLRGLGDIGKGDDGPTRRHKWSWVIENMLVLPLVQNPTLTKTLVSIRNWQTSLVRLVFASMDLPLVSVPRDAEKDSDDENFGLLTKKSCIGREVQDRQNFRHVRRVIKSQSRLFSLLMVIFTQVHYSVFCNTQERFSLTDIPEKFQFTAPKQNGGTFDTLLRSMTSLFSQTGGWTTLSVPIGRLLLLSLLSKVSKNYREISRDYRLPHWQNLLSLLAVVESFILHRARSTKLSLTRSLPRGSSSFDDAVSTPTPTRRKSFWRKEGDSSIDPIVTTQFDLPASSTPKKSAKKKAQVASDLDPLNRRVFLRIASDLNCTEDLALVRLVLRLLQKELRVDGMYARFATVSEASDKKLKAKVRRLDELLNAEREFFEELHRFLANVLASRSLSSDKRREKVGQALEQMALATAQRAVLKKQSSAGRMATIKGKSRTSMSAEVSSAVRFLKRVALASLRDRRHAESVDDDHGLHRVLSLQLRLMQQRQEEAAAAEESEEDNWWTDPQVADNVSLFAFCRVRTRSDSVSSGDELLRRQPRRPLREIRRSARLEGVLRQRLASMPAMRTPLNRASFATDVVDVSVQLPPTRSRLASVIDHAEAVEVPENRGHSRQHRSRHLVEEEIAALHASSTETSPVPPQTAIVLPASASLDGVPSLALR
ncbi:MAG: hypothetical protein MHM6MM_001384 [Cercozoa sp. M6MM]